MTSVLFLDSLNGWIGGDSSFIFRTTDGGKTWEEQYRNDEFDLKDIFFLDYNIGYAVAVPIDFVLDLYALILKTTDGGVNWTEDFYSEPNIYFNSVYYLDTLRGWMGGLRGNIVYTTNAGERWHQATIDSSLLSNLDIYDIKFVNENFAVASGGHFDIAGLFWISRDGGFNWQAYPAAIDPIADFHYFDTTHLLGVSKEIEQYGSGTARTTDGGAHWEYTVFDSVGPATTIAFRNSSEAWVSLSTNALFFRSLDSGYTWTPFRSPDNKWISKMQFTDSLTGYGVGEFGALIKYTNDSVNHTGGYDPSPNSCILHQNYPNPFNPVTVISFELAEPGYTELSVYDLPGNKVASLVNGYKTAGSHIAVFRGEKLASGHYFARLKSGAYSRMIKMLLLR